MLGIHLGFHGEETVDQLFLTHFQTEYGDALTGVKGHILGNIQNKCCLTHGRPGSYKYKVRRLHSRRPVIQINEACGNTGYASAVVGGLFDFVHGVHNHFTDRDVISGTSPLNKVEYLFLRLLHDDFHAVLAGIAVVGNLLHQPDQTAQHGFFRHNVGVIFNIGRGRHRRDQIPDKFQTADFRRHILFFKPVL